MTSDLELLFHKGEEFTKLDFPHVHCVVLSLAPETRSYIVEFSATGNIKRLNEKTLRHGYAKSGRLSRQDAIGNMGSDMGGVGGIAEDGEMCSP
jgi:hypothetical protein